MTILSFIGLGTMGAPMVRNLRAAGHTVYVYDVNPVALQTIAEESGARALSSPSDAPDTETVVLMLPNSDAVTAVLGTPGDPSSLIGSLNRGTLVVDMGSSNPEITRQTAVSLNTAGLRMVDAPVSGGPIRAAAGELTIMVGGHDADVATIRPILEALGTTITHTGPVGSAHALKALNNLLSATGLVAALEVLAVGRKFGLDPQLMLDVINASTGRNHATEVKIGQQVLSRKWNVGFSLALTVKDVSTALALAASQNVATPVSAAAVEVYRQALEFFDGSSADQSEIAMYLERINDLSFSDSERPPTDPRS